ncbi:MAG: flagellar hook-basal body complex protein, partial [Caulobacterales bacterium]
MRAMSIAATGMAAQEMNVEVISNNIANMNTTGFKRQRAEFQDLLYTSMDQVGAATSASGTIAPTGVQVGTGVKTGSVYRITEQGALTQTGNSYDMAISGRGYFKVTLPSGDETYTRAGNFSINAEG